MTVLMMKMEKNRKNRAKKNDLNFFFIAKLKDDAKTGLDIVAQLLTTSIFDKNGFQQTIILKHQNRLMQFC